MKVQRECDRCGKEEEINPVTGLCHHCMKKNKNGRLIGPGQRF